MIDNRHFSSKILFFLILLLSISWNLAYPQVSTENNLSYGSLVDKSKHLFQGKIDYIETKKIKGLNKPIVTSYTLTFYKNLSEENRKINIHLFNEQDFILYISNETGSYTINYKDKQVVIDNPDKLLSILMPTQAFFSFYGAEIGKNLLFLSGFKEIIKEYSTSVYFTEQKLYADYPNIQKKKENKTNNILYAEEYEFRTKDTLLTKHISKIVNPNRYAKGTPIKTETKLLSVILDDSEDFYKSYHYDYKTYIEDDFQVVDRRNVFVEKKSDNATKIKVSTDKDIELTISQLEKKQKIFQSQLEKLENELIPLLVQAKNSQNGSVLDGKAGDSDMPQLLSEIQQAFLAINDSTAFRDASRLKTERQQIINAVNQLKLQIEEQLAVIERAKQQWGDNQNKKQEKQTANIQQQTAQKTNNLDPVEKNTLPKTEIKQQIQESVQLLERKSVEQIIEPGNYYLVLGCFSEQANAVRLIEAKKKEYTNTMYLGIGTKSGLYMVGLGPYKTREEASALIKKGINGWILTK